MICYRKGFPISYDTAKFNRFLADNQIRQAIGEIAYLFSSDLRYRS